MDDSLDKKKLEQKNDLLGWCPGPDDHKPWLQKRKTCPHHDITQRKPQTQNEKNVLV